MVRDWDFVRKILLEIEKYQVNDVEIDLSVLEVDIIAIIFNGKVNPSQNSKIKYHFILLMEEGFIRSNYEPGMNDEIKIYGLSWQGHDFAEKLRNDNWWNEVKRRAEEKGVALTTEALSNILTHYMNKSIDDFFGNGDT
ncbi:MAG: DUF2513 domain-containing protein [Candidatus Thiodiazotropha sp.]